jgi:hypothetical protein
MGCRCLKRKHCGQPVVQARRCPAGLLNVEHGMGVSGAAQARRPGQPTRHAGRCAAGIILGAWLSSSRAVALRAASERSQEVSTATMPSLLLAM